MGIDTKRYEGYLKHAVVLNPEHGTNIALMANTTYHEADALYGHKSYNADERTAYGQLMLETHLTDSHEVSAGISLSHDYLKQRVSTALPIKQQEKETTAGIYLQYTYSLGERLIAMAGIRADHSSEYGSFLTPRLHLKYTLSENAHLRISAGKGYRSVHALAENSYLLGSGRTLYIDDLRQERAWNAGVSGAFTFPLMGKNLKVNAEYYHTRFSEQAVIDYDSHPNEIHITNLDGRSYSNTLQIDATYPFVSGLEVTAAYRLNDVKTTYGGRLREKPLTNRYKALLSASYKTPLGLWQFDATLQLNGGGRMPDPYAEIDGSPWGIPCGSSWPAHFSSYEQLSAQVTRWFRHFSVYTGGENLTGRRQKTPIIHAEDPWSAQFDPTLVWGPVSGAMGYIGIRINIGRI
jgi:outer membrane receptor protein involved in Fe transport